MTLNGAEPRSEMCLQTPTMESLTEKNVLVFLKLHFEFLTKVHARVQLQHCQLVYSFTVHNHHH